MSRIIPNWKQVLRFLFISTLLAQTLIVLACAALQYANAEVGWMQYRLPRFLFWVFVWVGLGAPIFALVTLIILWAKRNTLRNGVRRAEETIWRHLIILCVVNVCAVALWFVFAGLVFFGAGGSR